MVDYWSDYWKAGFLSSFAQSNQSNYSGEIALFWKQTLSGFNKPNTCILDIACGNGALIELALDKFNYESPRYIGIDNASLQIPDHLGRENVDFFQNTCAESLPLPDNSIDLAISQFGIEYTETKLSIRELARTLKPGGKLCVVLHHKDSAIVKPNGMIRSAIDQVMAKNGPFENLSVLINSINKFGKNNPTSDKSRMSLNSSIQHLSNTNKFGFYGTGFPELLKLIMLPSLDYKSRKAKLKSFRNEMKTLILRLDNLLGVALDSSSLDSFVTLLRDEGFFDIEFSDLRNTSDLLGISLHASL